MATNIQFTSIPAKRLNVTIDGSAMTCVLGDIKGWNDTDLTSGDLGDKLYASFRNSTGTLMELMELDPTTIASASITILKRGLKFDGDLTTQVGANKLTWIQGDTIVELGSTPPQLLNYTVRTYGTQTINDVKTFTSLPVLPATAPSGNQAASASWVASVLAGSVGTASPTVYGTVKTTTTTNTVVSTDDTRIPPQSLIDAGAGTSGTPSSTNKFETENDTSNAATETATTISFTASTKTIADSGNGFVTANFRAGDSVIVTGSASNDGTYTIVSVAAGAIVVAETLVDESAGATVTLATVTIDKILRLNNSGLIPSTVIKQSSSASGIVKFGGTGANGALVITSGTTTINLGGLAVFTKNYTSISITGTGKLAFSNPHTNGTIIILKSQGNVVLTSSDAAMIDASGMGAAISNQSQGIIDNLATHKGTDSPGTSDASGGLLYSNSTWYSTESYKITAWRSINIVSGSGGGRGATNDNFGATWTG
ncbi:hypothetical protein HY310_00525, partial [Candidatus Microgenomates bacterium]|nr:hypothetical protein [Candidatus Microgenomates bacterium]